MKNNLNISEERYLRALQKQLRSGLVGFRGVRRQRGGGFGSILFNLGKYAIPIFEKYVLPHAKDAVKNIMNDVRQGVPIKSAVKSNARKALKEVGKTLIKNTLQQGGRGLTSRRQNRKRKIIIETKDNER
ncbi:hypothetical protein Fcan01_27759 [Folsomia candida]|uniref:Uncharacterized protein n=1 Tax=Folsomia candida TaxID=158441 RepID=A0A226CZK1_FOLCA|nr:hypothetical protein Fcan01_27759 [Folsomia candida]